MNKTLIITAAAALVALGARAAQTEAPRQVWSLDSCIAYAVEHNITVAQSAAETLGAEYSVTEAKDGFLPQVSGSASQSWNFGRGLTSANTYANRNTSTFGWNVGLNLPLFQGLQGVRQLSYARENLRAVLQAHEAAKDNVALQVMAQYLQVLYCGEMVDVAASQADLAYSELQRRQAMLDAGRIPEADMLDARSQLAQAEMQLTTARNDRTMARLELLQMLRLQMLPDEFDVEPLAEGHSEPLLPDVATVYNHALAYNHGVAARRHRVEAAARAIALAKTGYIPRLSFNAGLSSNYYTLSGAPTQPFGEQMRQNFSKYVGFSLSVPIFDAFSTRNGVRRQRVQQITARLDLDSSLDELYKTISRAYFEADGARQRLRAASAAVDATSLALAAVQEKYNLGRATPTDFDTARNAYVRAASDRVQAKYELLLRARILDFYNTDHTL